MSSSRKPLDVDADGQPMKRLRVEEPEPAGEHRLVTCKRCEKGFHNFAAYGGHLQQCQHVHQAQQASKKDKEDKQRAREEARANKQRSDQQQERVQTVMPKA